MTQTPEEKGKALVIKFYSKLIGKSEKYISENWERIKRNTADSYFEDAKQCAIICACEAIIETAKQNNDLAVERYDYWNLVMQAIEQL